MIRTLFFSALVPALLSLPQTYLSPSLPSYGATEDVVLASPSQTTSIFLSPDTQGAASERLPVKVKQVGIVSSTNTGPLDGNYQYSYETENGIKQEVVGEMKVVEDQQVYVMRGSYSYPGSDGLLYVVDWYADETGFHPSAPHLPRSVEPDHPEVAAAVKAQLEQAAAEEEAAAASSSNLVYLEVEDQASLLEDQDILVLQVSDETSLDEVFAEGGLAGYGEGEATQLLDSYSLPSYTN